MMTVDLKCCRSARRSAHRADGSGRFALGSQVAFRATSLRHMGDHRHTFVHRVHPQSLCHLIRSLFGHNSEPGLATIHLSILLSSEPTTTPTKKKSRHGDRLALHRVDDLVDRLHAALVYSRSVWCRVDIDVE